MYKRQAFEGRFGCRATTQKINEKLLAPNGYLTEERKPTRKGAEQMSMVLREFSKGDGEPKEFAVYYLDAEKVRDVLLGLIASYR